jgi:hypothetical protein
VKGVPEGRDSAKVALAQTQPSVKIMVTYPLRKHTVVLSGVQAAIGRELATGNKLKPASAVVQDSGLLSVVLVVVVVDCVCKIVSRECEEVWN